MRPAARGAASDHRRASAVSGGRGHDAAGHQGGPAARVHPRRGRRPAGSGPAPARNPAGQQAAAKVSEIDAKIADLLTIRRTLLAALDAGCDDLVTCAGSPNCPLPFAELAAGEPPRPTVQSDASG